MIQPIYEYRKNKGTITELAEKLNCTKEAIYANGKKTGEIAMLEEDSLNHIFANNVKIQLHKKRWSQSDLAEKIDASRVNVDNILSNKANPTLKMMEKIAEALDYDFFQMYELFMSQEEKELMGVE